MGEQIGSGPLAHAYPQPNPLVNLLQDLPSWAVLENRESLFSTFSEWQRGHFTLSDLPPSSMVSNFSWHSLHWYSRIGI
jgi:hypothetical protein